MNKILVDNKIISKLDNVRIDGNVITFLESGDYYIEYTSNNKYNLIFNISHDIRLIESCFDKEIEVNNKYIINNGKLLLTKFYNNKCVNEKIDIDLCHENDSVEYNFSNICLGEEYYEININHKCKNTLSNICNKSIALKNSKLKFVINSNVLNDCVKSVLNQNTRIVTMGECDASISPNMFIDLDDVEARHGSIIGTFKDSEVFYLMSKGISYNDTLKLLIKGYLLSNIEKNSELGKRINNIIDVYWR